MVNKNQPTLLGEMVQAQKLYSHEDTASHTWLLDPIVKEPSDKQVYMSISSLWVHLRMLLIVIDSIRFAAKCSWFEL